jgi:ureidoacrylate peracid hydrolase
MKDWITPERTALLLIDMQVDFAEPCGAPGKAAIAEAASLADAARAAGVMCVFARLITREKEESKFFHEWKSRRNSNDPPLCREGTRGAEFVGPKPLGGEMVFSKKRYNAFSGTGLDAALRGFGIDTLVMAGLTTECCIDSSARDAFERDYHVFVVSDATACCEPELHHAALKALALNCAQIVSAEEIRRSWKI